MTHTYHPEPRLIREFTRPEPFKVHVRHEGSDVSVVVYLTTDLDNAACFAEGYFIKNQCMEASVTCRGVVQNDNKGRAWQWRKF